MTANLVGRHVDTRNSKRCPAKIFFIVQWYIYFTFAFTENKKEMSLEEILFTASGS